MEGRDPVTYQERTGEAAAMAQRRLPVVSGSGSGGAQVAAKPAMENFHEKLVQQADVARNLQARLSLFRNRLDRNLTGAQVAPAPDPPEEDMSTLPGVIGHLIYSLEEMGIAVCDLEKLV